MMLLTALVSLSFLHANIRLMEINARVCIAYGSSPRLIRFLSLTLIKHTQTSHFTQKRLLRAVWHGFFFLLILSNILIIVKQPPSIWTSFCASMVWRRVSCVSPLLWLLLKWLAKERMRVLLPERVSVKSNPLRNLKTPPTLQTHDCDCILI